MYSRIPSNTPHLTHPAQYARPPVVLPQQNIMYGPGPYIIQTTFQPCYPYQANPPLIPVTSIQGQPVPLEPELKQLASFADLAFTPAGKKQWNDFVVELDREYKAGRINLEAINTLTAQLTSLQEVNGLIQWLNICALNTPKESASTLCSKFSNEIRKQAPFIETIKKLLQPLKENETLSKGSEENARSKELIELIYNRQNGPDDLDRQLIKFTFAEYKTREEPYYLLKAFESVGILKFAEPIKHENECNFTICTVEVTTEREAEIALKLFVAISQKINPFKEVYEIAKAYDFEASLTEYMRENAMPFAKGYYECSLQAALNDPDKPNKSIPLDEVIYADPPYTGDLLKWISILAQNPSIAPGFIIEAHIISGNLNSSDHQLFSRFITMDDITGHQDVLDTINLLIDLNKYEEIFNSIVEAYVALPDINNVYYDDAYKPYYPVQDLIIIATEGLSSKEKHTIKRSKHLLSELVKRGHGLKLAATALAEE